VTTRLNGSEQGPVSSLWKPGLVHFGELPANSSLKHLFCDDADAAISDSIRSVQSPSSAAHAHTEPSASDDGMQSAA
jgi:hypothetical protein